MEPIFLEPIYKHNVWGGYAISKELKNTEETKIGESWEIAANKNGSSIIKNGDFKGNSLNDVFKKENNRIKIFGEYCKNMKKFPLLIKFIDAKENLSVQVHPNNYCAKKLEKDTGKTELWHILDCPQDGKIICGFNNNVKAKKKLDNLDKNNMLDKLNYLPIQKGDSILIEAGTVHAIMANTLICEIQQNSDLTYRVYDWDRNDKTRKLHLNKSKKVINVSKKGKLIRKKESKENIQEISHNKFFYIDKFKVHGFFKYFSDKKTFQAINVISGEGKFLANNNEYILKKGTSFIVPANLGSYVIEGQLEMLVSYIGKKA